MSNLTSKKVLQENPVLYYTLEKLDPISLMGTYNVKSSEELISIGNLDEEQAHTLRALFEFYRRWCHVIKEKYSGDIELLSPNQMEALADYIIECGAERRHIENLIGYRDLQTTKALNSFSKINYLRAIKALELRRKRSDGYKDTRADSYLKTPLSLNIMKEWLLSGRIVYRDTCPTVEQILSIIKNGDMLVCGYVEYDKKTKRFKCFRAYPDDYDKLRLVMGEAKKRYNNIVGAHNMTQCYNRPFRLVENTSPRRGEDIYLTFVSSIVTSDRRFLLPIQVEDKSSDLRIYNRA